MSMKTFFTVVSFLFLGIVTSVLIAGYISKDNRLTREAYTKKTEERLALIATSVSDSQQKIDILEEKFKEQEQELASKSKSTKAAPAKSTTTAKPAASSGTTLTKALVASHSAATDCWIIVSGKVYSVAPYLSMHPGGKSVIVKVCGKDATDVFTNRGGTGEHSSSAWKLLGQFLVGALGSSVKL